MSFLKCTYDEEKKLWSGGKVLPYYDFNCSVGKIIFHNMRNHPKNIFHICAANDKKITNYEALIASVRIAGHLKELGLTHEDFVGIVANNTINAINVVYACLMHCTPFHALNPSFDDNTMKHLFNVTKPKLIFCDGRDYEKVKAATIDFETHIYTLNNHKAGVSQVEELMKPQPNEAFCLPQELVLGGNQTVAVLCSSGTTGMPKAVTLSNHRLVFDVAVVNSSHTVYCASGLDWFSGVMMTILPGSHGCTRILSDKPFTPEHFVELVRKYEVNYVSLAPYQAARLVAYREATSEDFASVRFLTVGGGAASSSTLQRLSQLFKHAYLSYNYGLTEAGGVAGSLGRTIDTSVGKLLPGVRVRVVNKEGENMDHNKVGELYINHGHRWNGYYGNAVETANMYDSKGWFHSGDLGYFDDDNNLHVIDRKKEVLKYQGMHYWPAEIEQVIAELPEVVDVCVMGIRDEFNGDAAAALVVKSKWGYLTELEVKQHVAKRLPETCKHLHAGVCFVEKLPRNHNGKPMKRQAKAYFLEFYPKTRNVT